MDREKLRAAILSAAPRLPRGERRGERLLVALTGEERRRLDAVAAGLNVAPSTLMRCLVLLAVDELMGDLPPEAGGR